MKQDMWELRKIQSQGITDNAQYPAGTYIVFTAAAPYIPLFEQHGKDDIALSLVRHEEAWWIVNHSDELCCAVNEQVMEPHHRMRLNDGDTIEWGLSSWCLARTNDESRPDVSFPQLVQSSESVAEYLDLDWFKQQQLNPQNPFDIIPVRETASSYTGHEADSTLHQLYQEYQQALRPSGQEKPLRPKPFPRNEDAVTQDLTSLYDKKGDTDTLQDMVAGAPGIDAILDTLDTTGEGEMHWLAMESMPDILQLLSPELGGKTAHSEILPDLTRREHRIIGIDSHYRITPTQKNGNTAHEKNRHASCYPVRAATGILYCGGDSDGGAAGSGKSGEGALPPQPVSVAVCGRRLVAGATPASAMCQDGGQLYPGGPAVPGAGSLRNVPPHRFSG